MMEKSVSVHSVEGRPPFDSVRGLNSIAESAAPLDECTNVGVLCNRPPRPRCVRALPALTRVRSRPDWTPRVCLFGTDY